MNNRLDALFIQRRQVREYHVGWKVTYLPSHGGPTEHGTISSYNHKYVFVDFGTGTNKAVSPDDLVWGHS